jgi:hypothetical protein
MRSGGKSRAAGKLGPAAILNQNPIFEMASISKKTGYAIQQVFIVFLKTKTISNFMGMSGQGNLTKTDPC